MKKSYCLITVLVYWLLFPCVTQGQGILFLPSSKTKLFSDIRGEEVIVREWSTGEPLVHVRDADYPYRHWFLDCRYPKIEWKSATGSVAVWPHTVPCFHNWVENAELD